MAFHPHEVRDDVDRNRKYDGRVFLGRDVVQGLKVAQLQRGRADRDDVSGLGQRPRGLVLSFGGDDLKFCKINYSEGLQKHE